MYRLFSDQIEMLTNSYPNSDGKRVQSIIRAAVASAYADIGTMHRWSYLGRRTQINTVAFQSTGTIAYTSSTRTLTLTGATWPSWAAYGSVAILSYVYKIASRTSSTQVVLDVSRSPVDDLAASTPYMVFRDQYPLPDDFEQRQDLVEVGRLWRLNYVRPSEMLQRSQWQWQPNVPWAYTIRGSQYGTSGSYVIEFVPPPSQAHTYDFLYSALPRQKTIHREYTTGAITVSGTAVTGTNTSFTQAMVGCVLRVGDTDHVPTSIYGEFPSTQESVIASVTNSTQLVLETSLTSATGVFFLIDDFVDLPSSRLFNLFDRMCESQWEIRVRSDTRNDTTDRVNQAFRDAVAADQTTDPSTLDRPLSGLFQPFPVSVTPFQG